MGELALPIRVGICSGPVILRKTGRDEDGLRRRGNHRTHSRTAGTAGRARHHPAGAPDRKPGDRHRQHRSDRRDGLEGIAEPLPVFRLLSAADRPSWIIRSGAKALSTFVGREEERADSPSPSNGRGRAGRSGRAVADAGMGKSRLLHEFLRTLKYVKARGTSCAWRPRRNPWPSPIPDHRPAAGIRRQLAGRLEPPKWPPACHRSSPRWVSSPGIRHDAPSHPSRPRGGRCRLDRIDPVQRNRPAGALSAPDPPALCRSASPHSGRRGLSLARCVERRGAERVVRRIDMAASSC